MSVTRRTILALAAAAFALPAAAHHGWRWTLDGEFELTGVITDARLGNPHGLLTVEAEDEVWTVEVGQPWRNSNAGLTDEMLSAGTEVTARGHRAAEESNLTMKAERLVIDGVTYDLYPDRS